MKTKVCQMLTKLSALAGSSWYLLCETCREKYIKNCKDGKQLSNRMKTIPRRRTHFVRSLISPANSMSVDVHLIMKNNAMFLLELASSADTGKNVY